jgi:hypothetical protein
MPGSVRRRLDGIGVRTVRDRLDAGDPLVFDDDDDRLTSPGGVLPWACSEP